MKNKQLILAIKAVDETRAGISSAKKQIAELSKATSGPSRRGRTREIDDYASAIAKAADQQERAERAANRSTKALREQARAAREVAAASTGAASRQRAAAPTASSRPDARYQDYDLRAELRRTQQEMAARRQAMIQEAAMRVRNTLQAAAAERFGLNTLQQRLRLVSEEGMKRLQAVRNSMSGENGGLAMLRQRVAVLREELALRMKSAAAGARSAAGSAVGNIKASISRMGGGAGSAGGGGGGGGGGPGGGGSGGAGRIAGTVNAVRGAVASLHTAMAAIGAAFSAASAIHLIDEYKQLEARVRLVTKSEREHSLVMRELNTSAMESRVRLKDTADVYYSLARNNKALGLSQRELIDLTDTINKTVAISGTSAQAASFGLIQLGQAFGTGQLRGEELNSVLEQLPRLSTAIVDGLKEVAPELAKTVNTPGALKTLSEQGKLSVDLLLKAIQTQMPKIVAEFQKMPITVGQGLTVLRGGIQQFLVNFDKASQTTNGLATALRDLGTKLASPEFAQAAVTIGNAVAQVMSVLVTVVVAATNAISAIIRKIAEWSDVLVPLATVLGVAIGGVRAYVLVLTAFARAFTFVTSVVPAAIAAVRAFSVALLTTPLGWIITGIAALAGILVYLGLQYMKAKKEQDTIAAGMVTLQRITKMSQKEYRQLSIEALQNAKAEVDAAITASMGRIKVLQEELKQSQGIWASMIEWWASYWEAATNGNPDDVDGYRAKRAARRKKLLDETKADLSALQAMSAKLGKDINDRSSLNDKPTDYSPPTIKPEVDKDAVSKANAALRRFYTDAKDVIDKGQSLFSEMFPAQGRLLGLADSLAEVDRLAKVTGSGFEEFEAKARKMMKLDPENAQDYENAIQKAKRLGEAYAGQFELIKKYRAALAADNPLAQFNRDLEEEARILSYAGNATRERMRKAREQAMKEVRDGNVALELGSPEEFQKQVGARALEAYGKLANADLSSFGRNLLDSLTEANVETQGLLALRGKFGLELEQEKAIQQEVTRLLNSQLFTTREQALAYLQSIGATDQIRANVVAANEAMKQTPVAALKQQIYDFANGFVTMQDIGTQMANTVGNALGSISDAFVQLAMTGKMSFKDLARSIIAELMKIMVRALIVRAILSLIPGMGLANVTAGTVARLTPDATSTIAGNAGIFHRGGIAGSVSASRRAVSMGLFANAQRYHSGGLAGLKNGEVPIIANKGEAVLPTVRLPNGQMGVQASGGAGGGVTNFAPSITINMSGGGMAGGGDQSAQKEQAKMISEMVERSLEAKMMEFTQRQSRPGGAIRGNFKV